MVEHVSKIQLMLYRVSSNSDVAFSCIKPYHSVRFFSPIQRYFHIVRWSSCPKSKYPFSNFTPKVNPLFIWLDLITEGLPNKISTKVTN